MKTDTRQFLGWGARFRLIGRVIGLTGAYAALVGLFVLLAIGRELNVDSLRSAIEGSGTAQWAAMLLAIGVAVAAVIALFEIIGRLAGSGQRSATGINATVQILLALAVFAGLNVLAFKYFKRWDMTRDKEFTLPQPVAQELRKLKGQTTIVVLQQHKTFGQLSPKPDIYDYAAERKVVDKVHDLVDQFRLLGPQFNVVTLDVEAIGYEETLDQETAKRPGLKEAIAAAPDNSIFFYPDDRVEKITPDEARERIATDSRVFTQTDPKDENVVYAYAGNIPRLSFNEFYQLDKSASKEANPGPDGKPRGNLVLRPQGVKSFARRVLAIQEKRPRVGLVIIHEALATNVSEGWQEQYTSHGLRRALEDHGFEVVDILVKKWKRGEEPSAAAYNLDETQFERREAELESIEEDLRSIRQSIKEGKKFSEYFKEAPLKELDERFGARFRGGVTESVRQQQLRSFEDQIRRMEERIVELEKDRAETDAKLRALMKNERAFEDRRVTDVKAKLTRLASTCDLLIIPRHTLINTSDEQFITPSLFRLSPPQVEVVKDFMKQGKPVLACVGPNLEPNMPASLEPLDDFEKLLIERGIELGRQAIVFDAETKSFAARQAGDLLGGTPTEIPPVRFPEAPDDKKPNPIAAAMQATSRSADQRLDLRVRHPRPIYLTEGVANRIPFAAEFMSTSPSSWNEEQPFGSQRSIGGGLVAVVPPRYEPTPFDDPKKNTRDEERRGPFPIAVAIESAMPVDWYETEYADLRKAATIATPIDNGILAACLSARAMVEVDKDTNKIQLQKKRAQGRLVVIGHGGLFSGKQLSPAHEQLLLHTSNWLLNRDERLPRTDEEWKYPRVHRSEREGFLWKYGPFLGLPALFLYLGLIVWIVRRVR